MAQPKRIRKDTTFWHFTGQDLEHATVNYVAEHHSYSGIANALNEDAAIADERSTYEGACETGTAVFVRTETEWVG